MTDLGAINVASPYYRWHSVCHCQLWRVEFRSLAGRLSPRRIPAGRHPTRSTGRPGTLRPIQVKHEYPQIGSTTGTSCLLTLRCRLRRRGIAPCNPPSANTRLPLTGRGLQRWYRRRHRERVLSGAGRTGRRPACTLASLERHAVCGTLTLTYSRTRSGQTSSLGAKSIIGPRLRRTATFHRATDEDVGGWV